MGMPLSDSATVTMAIRDFRATEAEIDRLRAENSDLREKRVAPSDPKLDPVRDLRVLLDAVLPIAQLAVGHLDSATVRDWPHAQLVTIAKMIDQLHPEDANLMSLAIEFRTFAREAERHDKFRNRRHEAAVAHVQLESGEEEPIELVIPTEPT